MNFRLRSYRLAGCCILSTTIILLDGLTGFTQAPQAEHHFPTQPNPRITVSNAYSISIVSWEKNEVSIAVEISGASIQVDEVRIRPEKNKLGNNVQSDEAGPEYLSDLARARKGHS